MKGARLLLFYIPALALSILAACKFAEPCLEIVAQEAYNTSTNILVKTRFVAEEDEHSCDIGLTRESDSLVVTATRPVFPAATWNDLYFDVPSDGRYLFDFCVLDSGGTAVDCLHEQVQFWVDTENPTAPLFLESYLYNFPDSSLDYFAIFLEPHPDNATPVADSPVEFRYDLAAGPTPDSPLYDGSTGIRILCIDLPWPAVNVVAVDRAGNLSGISTIDASTYSADPKVVIN
jgi:hypothetical protein